MTKRVGALLCPSCAMRFTRRKSGICLQCEHELGLLSDDAYRVAMLRAEKRKHRKLQHEFGESH